MDSETANVYKAGKWIVCLIIFMGVLMEHIGIALAVGMPFIIGAVMGAYRMYKEGVKIQP